MELDLAVERDGQMVKAAVVLMAALLNIAVWKKVNGTH